MTPIEFAMAVLPDGPWCLTAIKPKQNKNDPGKIITEVFTPLQVNAFNAFVEEYNGNHNLYIQPNPPKPGLKFGRGAKMNKSQIDAAHYAHVDVDLEGNDRDKELDTILGSFADGNLEPSVLVFSGNGYQAWFKLHEPTTDFVAVQAVNNGLVKRFNGDPSAHDVSRLLRLPGTWNLPDFKKVERGCTKVQAEFMWHKPTTFALSDLPKEEETAAKAASVKLDPSKLTRIMDMDELDVPDRVKVIIVQGSHPDEEEIDKKRAKLGKDPSRSEWLWDVVCNLVRSDVSDETIYSIITDPKWGISESVIELGKASDKYALKQIEDAKNKVGADQTICVSGTDIDKTREKVLAAINAHLPVYRQGNRLVRIVQLDGTVSVSTLDPVWLSQLLAPVVTFTKQTAKARVEIAPPHSLLSEVLKLATLYPGHSLTGVATTPTLTRNEPGYDEETGLFLAFNEDDFPDMPIEPSREDAEAALGRLAANIRGFPFKDSTALSVALASQLVAVVRGQMSACPLFAFDASRASSGKTKLAEIAYVLASGDREPSPMQWPVDTAELEKRLDAQYMKGQPAFFFDNVSITMKSDSFCTMLTSSSVDVRVLGMSQHQTCSTRVLAMVTGNELEFAGDLAIRVLQCRLEPNGNPAERSFDWDPVDDARANRPRYVMDALTVLRWYVNTAGSPLAGAMAAKPIRGGTFDDFNMVRGALVSLGHNDPADSRVEVEDTESDENKNLSVALMAEFGNEPFVTADVGLLQPVNDKWCPRLMLLTDDKWNSAKAGRKIKRLKDKDWYGCKLVVEKDEVRNVRQWRWKGEVPEWVTDNRVYRSGVAEAQFRKAQGG